LQSQDPACFFSPEIHGLSYAMAIIATPGSQNPGIPDGFSIPTLENGPSIAIPNQDPYLAQLICLGFSSISTPNGTLNPFSCFAPHDCMADRLIDRWAD